MIERWNEICGQIEAAEEKLKDFIGKAGLSATQLRKMNKFIAEWNKAKKMAESFDRYIAPVDPIGVESPFDQDDFRMMWKIWKEYLQEQHGQLMKSRSEQMALHHLAEISENDPDRAMFFLRYAMANRYRNFFRVDQVTVSNPAKGSNDGSEWS